MPDNTPEDSPIADDRTAIVNSQDIGDLPPRQKRFVEEYARTLNGTRSAAAAGYTGDPRSLAVDASRLLTYANVKAYLSSLLAARHMGRDEILARLEAQARGSIAPFIDANGVPDLSSDAAQDNMGLIRRIDVDVSHGTRGTGDGTQDWETIKTRLETYSAKDALELLGRAQRMFADVQVDIDLSLDDGARADSIAGMMGQVIDVTPRAPIDSADRAGAHDTGADLDAQPNDAITP